MTDCDANKVLVENSNNQQNIAQCFWNSLVDAAIQKPANGVTQIVNEATKGSAIRGFSTETHLPEVKLVDNKPAEFNTPEWYAQQVGSGLGMVPWFLATNKFIAKPLLKGTSFGLEEAGMLPAKTLSPILESGLSGGIVEGVLKPSDPNERFSLTRAKNFAEGFATFGGMTGMSIGLNRFLLPNVAPGLMLNPEWSKPAQAAFHGAENFVTGGAAGALSYELTSSLGNRGFKVDQGLAEATLGPAVAGLGIGLTHGAARGDSAAGEPKFKPQDTPPDKGGKGAIADSAEEKPNEKGYDYPPAGRKTAPPADSAMNMYDDPNSWGEHPDFAAMWRWANKIDGIKTERMAEESPRERLTPEQLQRLEMAPANELKPDLVKALEDNFPQAELDPAFAEKFENGQYKAYELRDKNTGELLSALVVEPYLSERPGPVPFGLAAWIVTPDKPVGVVDSIQGKGQGYGTYMLQEASKLMQRDFPEMKWIVGERETAEGEAPDSQPAQRARFHDRAGLLKVQGIDSKIHPYPPEGADGYVPVAERPDEPIDSELLVYPLTGEQSISGRDLWSIQSQLMNKGYDIDPQKDADYVLGILMPIDPEMKYQIGGKH